jgi:hypothetical protein
VRAPLPGQGARGVPTRARRRASLGRRAGRGSHADPRKRHQHALPQHIGSSSQTPRPTHLTARVAPTPRVRHPIRCSSYLSHCLPPRVVSSVRLPRLPGLPSCSLVNLPQPSLSPPRLRPLQQPRREAKKRPGRAAACCAHGRNPESETARAKQMEGNRPARSDPRRGLPRLLPDRLMGTGSSPGVLSCLRVVCRRPLLDGLALSQRTRERGLDLGITQLVNQPMQLLARRHMSTVPAPAVSTGATTPRCSGIAGSAPTSFAGYAAGARASASSSALTCSVGHVIVSSPLRSSSQQTWTSVIATTRPDSSCSTLWSLPP